jgi:hypothetical protein
MDTAAEFLRRELQEDVESFDGSAKSDSPKATH